MQLIKTEAREICTVEKALQECTNLETIAGEFNSETIEMPIYKISIRL